MRGNGSGWSRLDCGARPNSAGGEPRNKRLRSMNASRDAGVSVVVITKNEREILAGCLGSVGFASEVMVVDDFSSDGTPDLARAAGAHVISRSWPGYAAQRQEGFEAATREWILWLD